MKEKIVDKTIQLFSNLISSIWARKINPSGLLCIVIAGGGTGGHLFPGIAVAEMFMSEDAKNRVVFIITGKDFEIGALSRSGFEYRSIQVEGIKGRGLSKKVLAILKLPKGIFQSIKILKDLQADLVLGVGSYTSGPVAIAAWLLGIKIVLHEQNVNPGITNRILLPFSERFYTSFKTTVFCRKDKKMLFTGNPVRGEIIKVSEKKCENNSETDKARPFRVLIVGGSQGARSINDAVIESLPFIRAKKGLHFIHQTGVFDEKRVKDAYIHQGISFTVKAFFNDMAHQYQISDLVICRAGATTVAEIAVLGKATIFIPYPFAADDHQVENAFRMVEKNAAEMVLEKNLTGKLLAKKIKHYALFPERIQTMGKKARNFGVPDAALRIVRDSYRLLGA